jgi:hypothetical protein
MSLELEKKARSLIENGDICGIQSLLTAGELSVHSITREYCDTLLGASYLARNTRIGVYTDLWQISVYEEQAEICSFLLEHGSPVAKSDAVVAGLVICCPNFGIFSLIMITQYSIMVLPGSWSASLPCHLLPHGSNSIPSIHSFCIRSNILVALDNRLANISIH